MAFFRKQSYTTLSQLVLGCQQQQPKAQTLFYDRYKGRMLGVCVRYARTLAEAEDIFQEAFVKIFQHINDLQNPESADSWVRSVVVRTAINYYNRTTRQEERLKSFDDTLDELVSDDYELLLNQQTSEALLALLSQLPDMYRIVVNLYLIEGYTHAQIGELLGIPPATVRSQYNRAKHLLVKKSQQNGIERHEFLG